MNKPLKWSKFLERATKIGHFSRRARQRANSWPTCAIGEHDVLLSDDVDYLTGDRYYDMTNGKLLQTLGIAFMKHVNANRVYSAKRVYQKINRIVKVRGLACRPI